jgi:hypothetical protein
MDDLVVASVPKTKRLAAHLVRASSQNLGIREVHGERRKRCPIMCL